MLLDPESVWQVGSTTQAIILDHHVPEQICFFSFLAISSLTTGSLTYWIMTWILNWIMTSLWCHFEQPLQICFNIFTVFKKSNFATKHMCSTFNCQEQLKVNSNTHSCLHTDMNLRQKHQPRNKHTWTQ